MLISEQSLDRVANASPELRREMPCGERTSDGAGRRLLENSIRLLAFNRKSLGLVLALVAGWGLWQIPPPLPLDERGVHFLASMAAGVILWVFEVFDEYVVALMLLLTWILADVTPPEVALSGFATNSWLFALGIFGIAAAVTKSGLPYRVVLRFLRRFPPDYKFYTLILAVSGLLFTPVMPTSKARIAIVAPVCRVISELMGFKDRSNGSAGVALSAYVGFGQGTFMFLTGASSCLIGWNLLSEPARANFGWGTWALAALPAGILIRSLLFVAVHFLFPVKEERDEVSPESSEQEQRVPASFTKSEWISMVGLSLALVGWLAKPLHGISETWVTLGTLLFFLLTGALDKSGFKNSVDWGFLLFLGIMSSLDPIMRHLRVDDWLIGFIDPVFSLFSFHPMAFLMVVSLLVYSVRVFLSKAPTIILLSTIGLTSWAESMGIHPGVLLITILMASEGWFLTYQDGPCQIAYCCTDGKAFSHCQARKLMVARFFASFLALAVSIPYWRMLGFIH